MFKPKSKEQTVGLVVLIAIIVAVWGFIAIRDIPIRRQGARYIVLFDKVTGLTPGDPVSVRGIKVGRVLNIDFHVQGVAVEVWIDAKAEPHEDASARLCSLGLIGEKYIDLEPGQALDHLPIGALIQGRYVSDLADGGDQISDILNGTKQLLTTINKGIDSQAMRRMQGDGAATVANLKELTDRLRFQSDSLLTRLDRITQTADHLVSTHQTPLDQALGALETSVERLPGMAAQTDSLIQSLRNLVDGLGNPQSTLGRLMGEDSLYQETRRTLGRMDSLLADVQRHPGRYLKIKGSLIGLF